MCRTNILLGRRLRIWSEKGPYQLEIFAVRDGIMGGHSRILSKNKHNGLFPASLATENRPTASSCREHVVDETAWEAQIYSMRYITPRWSGMLVLRWVYRTCRFDRNVGSSST